MKHGFLSLVFCLTGTFCIISACSDQSFSDLPDYPANHLTVLAPDDWDKVLEGEPVLAFVERVNKAALASPSWHDNYALAHYSAFCFVASKYGIEQYLARGGKGFPADLKLPASDVPEEAAKELSLRP